MELLAFSHKGNEKNIFQNKRHNYYPEI